MPGTTLHQDDLASGDDPFQIPPWNPFDKQEYPDFAIVAQSSRKFRYRKLYFVNFTTNEGETSQGRVIYSAQSTHRSLSGGDEDYCFARANDYKSCMVSSVDVCYNHAFISDGPKYRRVDWSQRLGFLSRLRAVARQPWRGGRTPDCYVLRSTTARVRVIGDAATDREQAPDSGGAGGARCRGVVRVGGGASCPVVWSTDGYQCRCGDSRRLHDGSSRLVRGSRGSSRVARRLAPCGGREARRGRRHRGIIRLLRPQLRV